MFNILNSFYFYDKKFYFTSCICLCSFISNIYFIYLNIAILCGEKDVDCSIFYVRHFKTKVHFYMKIFICFLLLVVLTYLTSISLRFHLNYIISFLQFPPGGTKSPPGQRSGAESVRRAGGVKIPVFYLNSLI